MTVSWTSQYSRFWGSWGDPGQDWLDWQIWPSGRELHSQSQAPGSIPPSPLVGSNLCASRRRTLRGSFIAKKSVLKLGIADFLDFNKKCEILIIPIDLGFCTGYNLCASRRRTLRGLLFAKKSVLKMRNKVFPEF